MPVKFDKVCGGVLLVAAMAVTADAATVAYWRFEGDGVTAPTDGQFLTDTNGRTAVQAAGLLAIDSSGNGNHLYTWDNNSTGHQYRPTTSAATVTQTGQSNNWSIRNNGANPASFTWSRESSPTVDIETIKPLAWTIEASILSTNTSGHRTFVGRDGNGVSANANGAPLYFKTFNGNLGVEFADEAGNWYTAFDATPISTNTWYNVAVVSDGTTVRLYKDSGAGYVEVASASLTGADRRLAYDDNGSSTVGDTQWGWSIGRGRYGTNDDQTQNHVDRWFGNIDEVRISDTALAPEQFLFSQPVAIPEPASLLAIGLVGLGLVGRRR